jgi:hypothetical protein
VMTPQFTQRLAAPSWLRWLALELLARDWRERLLLGDQPRATSVSEGSRAGLRQLNLDAANLPVKANRRPPDVRRQWIQAICCPWRK